MKNLSTSTQQNIKKARTVNGVPPSLYQTPYTNIGDLLLKQVSNSGDKPWLIFYPDNVQLGSDRRTVYTYREFYDLVCRTANFLLSQGVTRGDRIATVAYNHPDTVIQYFAAWLIGAVVVPINVGEDDKRIGYILENSQCKLAFVREQFIQRMETILNEHQKKITIVRVSDSHSPSQKNQIDYHKQIVNFPAVLQNISSPHLDDEALIVYTSGTTGLPKGVVLSQYNMLIDAKNIAEWHQMKPEERMMCVLPIHHVNGIIVTLMTPIYYGGSVVLNQKFHSDKFFERIAQEKVNVVSVVPTLLQFLIHENPEMSKYNLSALRHIICGAGPLTVDLALQFEKRFTIPIIHGYGLSETTCYSCYLPLDLSPEEHRRWLRDFGFPSIGVPIACNEMAIHDEHGIELQEGTKGEIVIRGHNVMQCYYENPDANERTFAFGWFRSGDEGFYQSDSQGRKFFFITGRIKELIIRGGSNISPFEIDEVLMNMPGVKAGLAIGFDNDWYGEEIGAYVQTKDGITLTEGEVIRYCRQYFSYQKCPKVVIFGTEIPVTSTGKYQRNKLKPLFEQWKSIQFTESSKQ